MACKRFPNVILYIRRSYSSDNELLGNNSLLNSLLDLNTATVSQTNCDIRNFMYDSL